MSRRGAHILTVVIAFAALASVFFGLHSYASLLLLRSAYDVGRPQVSSLRAWMTLEHVAVTYHVPLGELTARLGLPPDNDRNETLKSIADRRGVSRFAFVRETQRAIGAGAPPPDTSEKTQGGLGERVLSAVLAYGYPALAAALLLGAAGLPLPTGLVTVLAGSLAALGQLQWLWAAAIAVVASVIGDVIAFGVGRVVSETFLARHGRWIGYSAERFKRMQVVFAHWGGGAVIISRTLTSSLSSILEPDRRGQPLLVRALPRLRARRPRDLDLGLSELGLHHRQQYRGRQPIPRQSERAVGLAGGAGGGEPLPLRPHGARLRPVASSYSAAISLPDSAYLHS